MPSLSRFACILCEPEVLIHTRTSKVLHACEKINGGAHDDPSCHTLCGMDEWTRTAGDCRWVVVAEGEVTCKRCLKAMKRNITIDNSSEGLFTSEALILVGELPVDDRGKCLARPALTYASEMLRGRASGKD